MKLVKDTGTHFDLDEESARILMSEVLTRRIVDFDVSTGLLQHVGFRGRTHLEPHDPIG